MIIRLLAISVLFLQYEKIRCEPFDIRNKLMEDDLIQPQDLKYVSEDFVHVGFIACNIAKEQMEDQGIKRDNLEVNMLLFGLDRMVESLLKYNENSPIHLIFITDEKSKPLVKSTLYRKTGQYLSEMAIKRRKFDSGPHIRFPKMLKVEFVNILAITDTFRKEIDALKKYFTVTKPVETIYDEKTGVYHSFSNKYMLDLFFIAPFYPLAFKSLDRLLMFDTDLHFYFDLKELDSYYDKMEDEWMGIVLDQMKHYGSMIDYHKKKPSGDPLPSKTEKGVNSAVVLFNLKNMRNSSVYLQEITEEYIPKMTERHHFRGTLGDQDWFTGLSWTYPEKFLLLPCEYNFQLHQVFTGDCDAKEPKILHGILPEMMNK